MSSIPIDKRPIHTPVVTAYEKIKSADGFVLNSKYLKRYYSVIDAEVYFGNQFVEDVAYIDWNVDQNTIPLFGYNSYTYDEIAVGSRIISGVFDINFTSPAYLFRLLETVRYDSFTNMETYTVVSDEPELFAEKESEAIIGKNRAAPLWDQSFDIDVIFGQKSEAGNCVHVLLEGVVIKSSHVVLSGSASESPPNVRERYHFVARDVKYID